MEGPGTHCSVLRTLTRRHLGRAVREAVTLAMVTRAASGLSGLQVTESEVIHHSNLRASQGSGGPQVTERKVTRLSGLRRAMTW